MIRINPVSQLWSCLSLSPSLPHYLWSSPHSPLHQGLWTRSSLGLECSHPTPLHGQLRHSALSVRNQLRCHLREVSQGTLPAPAPWLVVFITWKWSLPCIRSLSPGGGNVCPQRKCLCLPRALPSHETSTWLRPGAHMNPEMRE